MAFENYILVDKKLTNTEDYEISWDWNLAFVSDSYTILQTALNRCVAWRWSWMHDESFWNELPLFIKNGSVDLITDDIAYWYVYHALKDMIDDWRIAALDRVTVIWKDETSISIEIYATIWTDTWVVSFEIDTTI